MSSKLLLRISAITIAFFLFATIFPFGKKNKDQTIEKVNPAFSEYITAYTTGYISNQSSVRILLANEITTPIEFGKPIEENLFDFSPKIKGTAIWVDNRTIEFRPEQQLPSDQLYQAEFYLSKLMEVPSELKTFEFEFRTIPQSFEVSITGVTTIDKQTLRWQSLNGTVSTADVVDEAVIMKMLKATQNGKSLKISIEYGIDRLLYNFKVDSIERTEQAGKMLLEWNGEELGLKEKGSKEVIIPALSDFKIMDIRVVQNPEQYISLQFSDPIMQKQNLQGLISLDNIHELKFISEDNEIRVYPAAHLVGNKAIRVEAGIKNILGYPLKEGSSIIIAFEEIKPQVKLIGKGVILPNSNGLIFPFEAVNLSAVDVKIIKIYENNILQFLQVNDLEGERELKRVGKTVLKKTIQLDPGKSLTANKWNSYSLDLAELIKTEPGAIYKVTISFKKQYSTYHCEGETTTDNQMKEVETEDEDDDKWGYYGDYYYDDYEYYYDEGYDYSQRDNPCNSSYYSRNKNVSRNILASNIGVIAKYGANGSMILVVTDLISTKPISGAVIEIYDYQQQIMKTVRTDNDGMAIVEVHKKPFVIVAKNSSQKGYLKLDDGAALSMSMFDVSGETIQKGIKGFIYGERGVWRPGDTLFINFILEDKEKKLPVNHPVSFELLSPLGQVVKKVIKTSSTDVFYNFTTVTEKDAPTGNWTARVKVGGATFIKNIKVETIMPNRLKINLDFGVEKLSFNNKNVNGNLEVKWLHGAIAKDLKAKVEVALSKTKTVFKKYEDYVFDNPLVSLSYENQLLFDGAINDQGKAIIKPDINIEDAAPGMVKANFTVRVFEKGGAFSIDHFSLPYSPYSSYIGIKVPEGNPRTKMLCTDTNHIVRIVTLNGNGVPVSINKVKVEVFKVNWRWWWESTNEDIANYAGHSYNEPYQTQEISTVNGRGQFVFRINQPDWGRFYIKVTNEESGHATGQTVYIDWPSWAGSSPKGNQGATMLSFNSDKPKYNIGENIKLTIPSGDQGRALISIESGSKIINSYWTELTKGQTIFNFTATPEMAPNVYVNVTLLQPHAQTKNDLPIRLYGVIPIQVEDPNTHLNPVIKTTNVWKPEEKTSITVSEQTGKEMTYTLAIVDDGLLDLTRFKTPDPWSSFYAREALGVKTWDMFDMVLGAYGGRLERILSIGGDGDVNRKGGNKANRFKPMVKFMGPFHLGKGEKKIHEFIMPQYIGSVRAMVIAGHDAAYGVTDKTIPVRKPLMILGTLPRVVGPGEAVDLPVTVFAMEKHVKDVRVEVIPNNYFTLEDGSQKTITFSEIGDDVVNFRLKVKSILGVGKVKIIAKSGNEKATYEVELDVRNPNPKIVKVIETAIDPGKIWSLEYTPVGMYGTNQGTLELSSIPPINLQTRLKYLIGYPHGCIEQTTSSVFPQLYLTDIMELTPSTSSKIENNIKAGIQRLRSFQTSSGGMAYWPGQSEPDAWGTNYAGHFMIEAESKGYSLPIGLLENWKRYQKQKALSWTRYTSTLYYHNDDLIQAYRLYTLALAKAPELGAMNRLKEDKNLSVAAKWRLAAAYSLAGQSEVAKKLIAMLPSSVKTYSEMAYSYGSSDRDEAMILETLTLMGERNKAFPVLKNISARLSKDSWMSTQTTSYCLVAVSKFIKASGTISSIACNYKLDGVSNVELNSKSPIVQVDMKLTSIAAKNIEIRNISTGVLFARVVLEGVPETGDQTSTENNLSMNISYTRMDGTPINPEKLDQGTDFIAQVSIGNPGAKGEYMQMALSQIFPSGWEIHNMRMDETETIKSDYATYQDIRDDRVYTYFNISPNQTKNFRVLLNAAYIGKYYLPSIYCEAMYDNTINAVKPGRWVEVIKPGKE